MKNKKNYKLVSIIIVSYNNLNYILDTIDSVLMQNYPNIELIISDDCTEEFDKDNYINYIARNNKGNLTNLIVHKNTMNLGTVKNLNSAIKMSNGSIIKLIAADDAFYDDTVVTTFVKFIDENKSNVVASRIAICDSGLNILSDWKDSEKLNRLLKPILTNYDRKKCLKQLCKGSFIPAPGVWFTQNTFTEYGYFDETYILLEDWPMWFRLAKNGCRIDYADVISVKYRKDVGISMTPNATLRKDRVKFIKDEILPYKEKLGYWFSREINRRYIKEFEYAKFSFVDKLKFQINNLDHALLHLIPNKIISK